MPPDALPTHPLPGTDGVTAKTAFPEFAHLVPTTAYSTPVWIQGHKPDWQANKARSTTDTGLTPSTAYTYTAESTDGTSTSAPSAPLTVTTTISIASLDGNENDVSIKDAKFLYYAHALDLAPEDSTALARALGPLTSFGDDRLGDLLTAVRSLSVDLNSDEATDAEDAAVFYYSFALEASLGDGSNAKPGILEIKKVILGPLAPADDMNTINAMLQRIYTLRGGSIPPLK